MSFLLTVTLSRASLATFLYRHEASAGFISGVQSDPLEMFEQALHAQRQGRTHDAAPRYLAVLKATRYKVASSPQARALHADAAANLGALHTQEGDLQRAFRVGGSHMSLA